MCVICVYTNTHMYACTHITCVTCKNAQCMYM